MTEQKKVWLQRRRRISEIIEAGKSGDWMSRGYDILSTVILLINVAVTALYSLRVWTASFVHPALSESRSMLNLSGCGHGCHSDRYYSRLKRLSEYAYGEDVHFIKVNLKRNDSWIGKAIMDLSLFSLSVVYTQRINKLLIRV